MKKRLSVIYTFLFIFLSCSATNLYETNDTSFNDNKYKVNETYIEIPLDSSYEFASFSKINSGKAKLYKCTKDNKNGITVALNAGHGTKGGNKVKTYSHPDKTGKVTGGTNANGAVMSTSISDGMSFIDGMREAEINRRVCIILRALLLDNGYNVLMIREGEDVQLDNIARTVICNNNADIHIAVHFDGDNYKYDKGCFYCSIPKALDTLPNVKLHREDSERLGKSLVQGLKDEGFDIYNGGKLDVDLTQTSYSTIPTCDIELGNNHSDYGTKLLEQRAKALLKGINLYFNK